MKTLHRYAIAAALLGSMGFLADRASAQMTDPDQERARQLVLRIRRSMREIDTLLLTGSQPEKIEKELSANVKRLEELLKDTESKSQSVIQNIDELIKLTKYQESKDKKSGGGGGQGDSPPQGGPGKQPTREKSQDPQELQKQPQQGDQPHSGDPKDGQQDPKDGKDPKDQKKQSDAKGDPKSGRPDRQPPDQKNADRPPPKEATGEFERQDTSGRWGMLPPKDAEDLQRRNAEEFPQRYRQWMELYFRRMNKLPARDSGRNP